MTDADRPATGPDWPTIDAELAEHEGDFDSPQWRATGEDAAPRTEAGRTLYEVTDHMKWTNGAAVGNRYMRDAILAIEAEAAQGAAAPPAEPWRDTVKRFGVQTPAQADALVAAIDRELEQARAAQGAAAPPDLDLKTLSDTCKAVAGAWVDDSQERGHFSPVVLASRIAAEYSRRLSGAPTDSTEERG